MAFEMHTIKDYKKTKKQLINELVDLRQHIAMRDKSETERKESEEIYRAIFENTGTAIAVDEEDTTISMINTECEILFGYPKEDLESKKSWMELIHKDDLEKMKEYHRLRRTDPEAAPLHYEFRLIDSYGNVKNIFATVVMIPGAKKSVGSFIDITECKEKNEILKEKNSLYRTFINSTSVIVFLKDEQSRNRSSPFSPVKTRRLGITHLQLP